MRKWAVRKPEYSDVCEVWEYIDKEEDIGWNLYYIKDVIKKCGKNRILPVLVNDLGGWHIADKNEIIEIIESDTRPELSFYKKYVINNKNFKCGWISPDCNTYSCSPYGHYDLAYDICKEYNFKNDTASDDYLIKNGWVKVSNEGWYGNICEMNDNQIKFLESLNINHFLDYFKNKI